MIILNIELGEEFESKFYQRAKEKKLTYLKYVEELIIEDLETYESILRERKREKNKEGKTPPPFIRSLN